MADAEKILILASTACAYPGADAVGQAHLHYAPNTYVLRVPSLALLPDSFYLRCFEKGIGAIIVMSCGSECPFRGAYEMLSQRVDRVYLELKGRGINPKRLKLCAICTVCTKSFLKEVKEMNEVLASEAKP